MNLGGGIGEGLARSLVTCLSADCGAAAALAAAADLRRGRMLDASSLPGMSNGALLRVTADFEQRGWLIKRATAWHVPEIGMPSSVPAFLAGMAAMRGPAADEEAALTAVTLPQPPSAIAMALPATGLAYAALVSTEDAMGVRGSSAARGALWSERERLQLLRVTVLNYLLRADGGYETFHAKVVLADEQLAYVGSANLLVQLRHSMELGNVVRGRAARVVASVVRAVEAVSAPWDWHR